MFKSITVKDRIIIAVVFAVPIINYIILKKIWG